jgi:malate dehydrogenase (oxaloacetate-decarboxylating)(NADP+)
MLASMAANPIIFALANPDPEITPEEAAIVRGDCYIATGRSDYPNQVNNVLGFPYIFRGALDVRAKTINQEMKVAAAEAIAALAREDVPEEVDAAYAGRTLRYGREYMIPTPFDPRLIATVPVAVARAATNTGVARQPLANDAEYAHSLKTRFDPVLDRLERVFAQVRTRTNRVVFAEGEEERAVRAALAYQAGGYGQAILVGREDVVEQQIRGLGHCPSELTIINARLSTRTDVYTDYLYDRLRRRGHLRRDCQRQVNQGRNVFSALMLATGDADSMITGLTRPFFGNYNDIRSVLDPMPGHMVMGMTLLIARGQPLFLADTTINERPSPDELAQIAAQTARAVRALGIEPRAAFLSYSNFGQPLRPLTERVIASVRAMDDMGVDFEYDGEMTAEVALDYPLMKRLYPFCRLSGPANVLIMPALHTANVAAKMVQKVSGESVIGPLLLGLEKPVQIIQLGSTVTEILNTAILGAHAGLTNLSATRAYVNASG